MSAFHFLRPEFLLFLFPAWLLVWWLLKQQNDESKWQKVIDKKLLKHLLVEPEQNHAKIPAPWHLGLVLTLLIVALSGPSWKLKDSPFTQDDTKIALIINVNKSMLTTDIMPNRLSRASIKIEDLLKERTDTKAALLAYSGTAHVVLPLTSDHSIVKTFAQALDPGIMPLEGNNIQDALLLAMEQLESKGSTIIVLTDTVVPSNIRLAIKEGFKEMNVIFWQMASSQLTNEADFKSAASMLDGKTVTYARDDKDVKTISSMIDTNFKNAAQDDSNKYEDGGYYLVPLIFLLLLMWARQGFMAELWRRS
jgi:Ca-activated chloride channel family protein